MEKILDIIVPYYNNSNEMIIRLLNSINQQININKNEIGVIFVDDNSPTKIDNCIFSSFSDLKIDYYLKEKNEGPGLARQFGLEKSNAKYVTFVDADDMLFGPDILEKVINYIKKENPEMILSYYFRYDAKTKKRALMTYNDIICLHGAFFNREKLVLGGLKFHNELWYYEDTYFCKIATNSLNVQYLDFPTYIWIINDRGMSALGNEGTQTIQKRILEYMISKFDTIRFLRNNRKLTPTLAVQYLFDVYAVVESELFENYDIKDLEKMIYSFYLEIKPLYDKLNEHEINQCIFNSYHLANHVFSVEKNTMRFSEFLVNMINNGKCV